MSTSLGDYIIPAGIDLTTDGGKAIPCIYQKDGDTRHFGSVFVNDDGLNCKYKKDGVKIQPSGSNTQMLLPHKYKQDYTLSETFDTTNVVSFPESAEGLKICKRKG